jgi:hypothetical protein
MFCTFECTYCKNCIDSVLFNVCPNCGGGFEKRPIRPSAMLIKYPASNEQVFKPVNQEKFESVLKKYKKIEANQR